MFYTSAFRTAFARGTSLYYEIVCPTQPGGNVNNWLYLTATNRAQKGVEAFVAYRGQNDTALRYSTGHDPINGRRRRNVAEQLFEYRAARVLEHHAECTQRRRPMGQFGRPHGEPKYDSQRWPRFFAVVHRSELHVCRQKLRRRPEQAREEMGSKRPSPPGGGKIADRRAKFERLSRQSPRDEEAERAFIEGKMEMVRTAPNLTEEEKQRALKELKRKLRPPPRR